MGALTVDEIVAQGLALTPRTDLSTLAKVELKAWLRQHARDWPWPILKERENGIALASGTAALAFGASAVVTEKVQRVLDPIWLYKSDYSARYKVRIRDIGDGALDHDETVNNPATNIGTPLRVKVRYVRATDGQKSLVFTPIPDRDFLLAIDYIVQPDDPEDDEAPWYENDRTMIKVVECFGLQYAHRYDALESEREVLAAMQREDRVRYGQIDGSNATLPLDGSVFK